MKITPVNTLSNIYNKSVRNQNFSGLWGKKTTHPPDIDPALGMKVEKETAFYYPFLGETPQQLKEAVLKNSTAYIQENPNCYVIKESRICTTLPFTEGTYNQYLEEKAKSKIGAEIHSYVKDKFFNPGFQNEQESASNSIYQ